MANFHFLETVVDRVVGGTFEEQVKHIPKANGRPDQSRPTQAIRAVLHFPADDGAVSLDLGANGSDTDTKVTGADAAMVVQRSHYPGISFREGDSIHASEADGSPRYWVKYVSRKYSSILIVHLVDGARRSG